MPESFEAVHWPEHFNDERSVVLRTEKSPGSIARVLQTWFEILRGEYAAKVRMWQPGNPLDIESDSMRLPTFTCPIVRRQPLRPGRVTGSLH